MFSLSLKPAAAAAASAVRMPQLATSTSVSAPIGHAGKRPPLVAGNPPAKVNYQAEKARHHAQCRRAMAF